MFIFPYHLVVSEVFLQSGDVAVHCGEEAGKAEVAFFGSILTTRDLFCDFFIVTKFQGRWVFHVATVAERVVAAAAEVAGAASNPVCFCTGRPGWEA